MSITFYGERLRQLRLINDKSLLDVGNAIYTTKQYIQQLERDVQKPTELTLDALASYFDVLPNFFELPYSNRIYEADCYFRKAKSTPLNVKEKAQHFASLLEDYVAFIEDEFDLPSISFLEKDYDYTKLSNLQIEQAADELRKSWGLDLDTPIDNMTKALENAGAIVTYFDELSDKIDAFSINRKRPIVIRNNEKESGCRLRFDLAHECGHLVLHKYADKQDEYYTKFAEKLANHIDETKKENKFENIIKRAVNWLFNREQPAAVTRSTDKKIVKFTKANIEQIFKIREQLMNDTKPKEFSDKLYQKFKQVEQEFKSTKGYTGDAKEDAAKHVIKMFRRRINSFVQIRMML